MFFKNYTYKYIYIVYCVNKLTYQLMKYFILLVKLRDGVLSIDDT